MLQLLDHNLAEKLFSLGRTMLGLHAAEDGVPRELVRCTEKIVKLSARVACRFIHSGFTVSQFISPGPVHHADFYSGRQTTSLPGSTGCSGNHH